MDNELEEILAEVNKNLKDKLIIFRKNDDGLFLVIREDIKYAEFQGEIGSVVLNSKEFKPLLDYLEKNNYKTNLE